MNSVLSVPTFIRMRYVPDSQDREVSLDNVHIQFVTVSKHIMEKFYPVLPNFPIKFYDHGLEFYNFFNNLDDKYFEFDLLNCAQVPFTIKETSMFSNVDATLTGVNVSFFPIVEDSQSRISDAPPVSSTEARNWMKRVISDRTNTGPACKRVAQLQPTEGTIPPPPLSTAKRPKETMPPIPPPLPAAKRPMAQGEAASSSYSPGARSRQLDTTSSQDEY